MSTDRQKRIRALAEIAVFVSVWMALGWLFSLDANSYLLLGIPLTLVFQAGVRRQSIADAWYRSPSAISRSRWLPVAALLAAIPVIEIFGAVGTSASLPVLLWLAAALAGAVPASRAILQLRKTDLRPLGVCLGATVSIAALYLLNSDAAGPGPWIIWGRWILLYLPVLFVLEEVTFRGVLDNHVAERAPGKTPAVFVAALWGLWHLPVAAAGSATEILAQAVVLVLFHSVVGLVLAWGWRRTGNLLVPGLAHAVLSAARNAWVF